MASKQKRNIRRYKEMVESSRSSMHTDPDYDDEENKVENKVDIQKAQRRDISLREEDSSQPLTVQPSAPLSNRK